MLKKVLGTVGCLALAGLGVALLGGWLDPAELSSDEGSGRRRSLAAAIQWLTDTLGTTGAGALLIGVGVVLLLVTWRKKSEPQPAA